MRRFLLALSAIALLASPVAAAPGDRALEDVRILSADDMEGRLVGSPGGEKARAYILGRLRDIGLAPVEQPFVIKRRDGSETNGVNLIARIEGSTPDGKVMVITAHYDHLGIHDGQIYNGADDNASGVAGLLAVAEAFRASPPKHTVLIVALDAEEGGLRGARAFLETPPVPAGDIALNINFDMLAKNARGELYAAGGSPNPWVRARLEALVPTAPVSLKLGHDTGPDDSFDNWTYQSDHGVFARAGIPWVYFGVEDHPEYHKPTDDFATVPQAFFRKAVETVIAAARLFDEQLDTIPAR
ncbi:MAG: M20/M25/M40 family metallo-hydrolase [Caulobacter sp.]|nr:M20/M25/M40 family metallo-hydrolase [Caulobacter sp.]